MSSFTVQLIDVIVRGFVLMSSAWVIALIIRRRSASLRAGVWTVTFASLLALPAIARVTPAWKIAVLPAASQPAVTQPEQPVFEGRVENSTGASRRLERVGDGALQVQRALLTSSEPAFVVQNIPASAPPAAPLPVSAAAIALGLWATVAFVLVVRIAVNRIATARLIRRSSTTCAGDIAWRDDVEVTRVEMGITRRVGIRFTDAVAVPAVIGVWRPTLLLPLDAGEWSADARRVVILHELAHVARWDAFDQLVTEAGCALYWIVPPVWIAARSAASLREQATDDAVIRAGVRPSAYAAELIDLAQNIAGVEAGAASLAMAGSRIQDRVTAILDPSARRGRITLRSAIALIFVAGLTVTALAAISPERQTVVPPTPPAPVTEATQFPPPPRPAPPTPAARPAPAPEPPQSPPLPPMPAPRAIAGMPPGPPAPPRPFGGSVHTANSGPEKSTLCPDGRDNFSNMSNSNKDRRTWSVKISGRGCAVELKSEGRVEFSDDFTDVASITPSGYVRLSVDRGGSRRELDIDGKGTALTHTYRVDGSARAYDAAAKLWFGDFLIDLDRETAVGVEARFPKLLKQGGVDGVLKETALMTSDYARSRYYSKLGGAVKLSSAEAVRILNQAATLGTQDYYGAELLKAVGAQVGDSTAERAALLALVNKMQSDYYIVEGVNSAFTTRAVTASDVDFLLRILPRVESDYYKYEMVRRIVSSMRGGGTTATGRQAIIGAVTRIKSGYYASETVRSVLNDPQLGESDLLRLVDGVKPIREDHYKSEALRAIVRHTNASAKVRQAVIDASAGMSQYYRDELLRFVRTT